MHTVHNLGSLNIDHVYRVPHFVRPGETLATAGYKVFHGGKGFNQSVALARAGARVRHIGAVGPEGGGLVEFLAAQGCDTKAVRRDGTPTGHAIIQVNEQGQNAIFLHAGANHAVTEADVASALEVARPGDWFLAQNETSCVPEALRTARTRGLRVAFNPAPMTGAVCGYPLECVDVLFVNETEGHGLTGKDDPAAIAADLRERHPHMTVVCTLGAEGAYCAGPDGTARVAGERVKAVDTTAAGDCFIGYFIAACIEGLATEAALSLACRAAAISVTRPGAAVSLPLRAEVKLAHPARQEN